METYRQEYRKKLKETAAEGEEPLWVLMRKRFLEGDGPILAEEEEDLTDVVRRVWLEGPPEVRHTIFQVLNNKIMDPFLKIFSHPDAHQADADLPILAVDALTLLEGLQAWGPLKDEIKIFSKKVLDDFPSFLKVLSNIDTNNSIILKMQLKFERIYLNLLEDRDDIEGTLSNYWINDEENLSIVKIDRNSHILEMLARLRPEILTQNLEYLEKFFWQTRQPPLGVDPERWLTQDRSGLLRGVFLSINYLMGNHNEFKRNFSYSLDGPELSLWHHVDKDYFDEEIRRLVNFLGISLDLNRQTREEMLKEIKILKSRKSIIMARSFVTFEDKGRSVRENMFMPG
ncbi:MAG: hypothetical protein H7833_08125 [Magnetococcus sp. DMHC-1]|nr:hypothetical protein [Magnetococcales bacterium]